MRKNQARGIENPIECIEGNSMKYLFRDVGPDTEKTNDELLKLYESINILNEGRTFDELLDRANSPNQFLLSREKSELSYLHS